MDSQSPPPCILFSLRLLVIITCPQHLSSFCSPQVDHKRPLPPPPLHSCCISCRMLLLLLDEWCVYVHFNGHQPINRGKIHVNSTATSKWRRSNWAADGPTTTRHGPSAAKLSGPIVAVVVVLCSRMIGRSVCCRLGWVWCWVRIDRSFCLTNEWPALQLIKYRV